MQAQNPADTIFINGNIYTGAITSVESRPAKTTVLRRAQAMAVRGGRIVAIGSNGEALRLKDRNTQVIDLGGRFVMPGFNDAHLHLASGGFEKLNVSLAGAKSLEEMKARIAERAKTTPAGEWITGRGWDDTKWTEVKLPSRQDLDEVTGDHPAVFSRADGHSLVANSAALRAGGVTRETPDPAGGKIDRDAQGEPTGILRESAMGLVSAKEPRPTIAQRRRAIQLALEDAARWGVTSMQDNSSWEDFLIYEEFWSNSQLTARICEWLPLQAPLDTLQEHRAYHPQTDPLLRTGMLKGFMDGSLGSRTAAMLAPFEDNPKNSGLTEIAQPELNKLATERVGAGFQLGFHAIGDRGVQMALDAFAEAERYAREHNATGAAQDFRLRVEHAQVTTPAQLARFRELGVISSMQPNHLLTDMNWAVARIGAARAKHAYAWREFLDNGVRLAFGTDYPVEPITPFRGLYAAITRKDETGAKEFFPEQRLSIDEAIAAYTSSAAFAEFQEKDKGTLARGMLADFVVLDRDITKVPPPEILKTTVLRTVVAGKTVYEAK
jgi:hypothetical protein